MIAIFRNRAWFCLAAIFVMASCGGGNSIDNQEHSTPQNIVRVTVGEARDECGDPVPHESTMTLIDSEGNRQSRTIIHTGNQQTQDFELESPGKFSLIHSEVYDIDSFILLDVKPGDYFLPAMFYQSSFRFTESVSCGCDLYDLIPNKYVFGAVAHVGGRRIPVNDGPIEICDRDKNKVFVINRSVWLYTRVDLPEGNAESAVEVNISLDKPIEVLPVDSEESAVGLSYFGLDSELRYGYTNVLVGQLLYDYSQALNEVPFLREDQIPLTRITGRFDSDFINVEFAEEAGYPNYTIRNRMDFDLIESTGALSNRVTLDPPITTFFDVSISENRIGISTNDIGNSPVTVIHWYDRDEAGFFYSDVLITESKSEIDLDRIRDITHFDKPDSLYINLINIKDEEGFDAHLKKMFEPFKSPVEVRELGFGAN